MTVQDRPDFVSVAAAARRLGVSTATVKRRIARGTLEAEQLQRPRGYEYRVRLTCHVSAPSTERSDSEPAGPLSVTTQDVSALHAALPWGPFPTAAITSATVPLVERLAVADAIIERQVGTIRELERENGRLTGELAALRTAQTLPASNLTHQSPELMLQSFAGRWRALGPWLLAIVAALTAGALVMIVTVSVF